MAGLTLVTGGAGSGKTARLVALAAGHYEADRFAPLLVLVPTARHADQFRRRLVERAHAVFGLDVATINQHAQRLTAGRMLSRDVADELLQRVTGERSADDAADAAASRFHPIVHTGGLHALVRAAVTDLVADAVDPAAFEAAARATSDLDLRALADVYAAYRPALDSREAHHPAEAAALAASLIASGEGAPPPLVLVDGVQFLRGGEVALVAALATVADVWISLDPGAGARSVWTAQELARRVPSARTEALDATGPAAPLEAATAADDEAQLREMARSIKEKLDADRALRPSDFAVVFRRVTPHLAVARRVFHEYGLPLDAAAGERLAERPLGAWVLRLLRLPAHDWRLTDVLDVCGSGFMEASRHGFTPSALERLRRTGRRHDLWGGLDALSRIQAAIEREIEAGRSADPESARASGRALSAALADLGVLLDAAPRRPAEHAARLDAALFGTGGLVRAVTEDYPTLDVEVQALRREFAAVRVVDQEVGQEPLPLPAFVDALEVRMQRPSTLIRQPGGVLLAPMHTLHGLRFRHVLVGGLSEGEFPVPRRTDTFLDAEARTALATAGLVLPPEPRASEDELWRTAITRATDGTTLWRPRLDAKGRPAAASYFFDAAVPADTVRRAESALPPERTASVRELAISLTSAWPYEARRPKEMAAWDVVVRAAPPVEQRRRSFEPAGRHEGRVPGVDVSWLMEPAAGWSASRLESYRTCSFQFFAHYVLQLDELREEREQADAGTRGNVIHEILEDAVAPLVESGRALTPGTVEVAVARLRERARGLWDSAPARFAFGRAALWRYEGELAIRQMEDLLRREAATSAALGLDHIVGGEAAFLETLEGDPPLLVQARIDRLDEGPGVIQIVDYKSGRFIPRRDAESGDKLQLQLYALVAGQARAAERVVARYAFLRLKPGDTEWSMDTDRPEDAAMLTAAAQVARDVRTDAQAGRFEVRPRVATCPSYCAFINACRVNHYTRYKHWGPAGAAD